MSGAARYLRKLAREPATPSAPVEREERLSAAELARALRYAEQVRAPIVAIEAVRDALEIARYDEGK